LKAGVRLEEAAKALKDFQGVARRYERVGEAGGVRVIDDYAHNPAKLAATLETARLEAKRVLAVFQLQGFSPARFMKNEFIESLVSGLGPNDILWMPEIYYAGGTVSRDISGRDIAEAVAARGRDARFVQNRAAIVLEVARAARSGDVVLVMGARDPSLPRFAQDILEALAAQKPQ